MVPSVPVPVTEMFPPNVPLVDTLMEFVNVPEVAVVVPNVASPV